ncbi:hypothetical protein [uncultured Sphingomonas sp.]|uniref:hypothetical protein n=1 Tax=uncultured Sphingomonas sp. TaxID=158754 RepID=UPI0025F4D98B|nr:hypothetical protein [uncultured Sphingomonas sp.]
MVRAYYAAVNRHDYRTAHRIWSGGHSLAALTKGYGRTKWVEVETMPPFRTEGAAGSVYCTVNVRIRAELAGGTRQRFAGAYILRRINDVEGSTAAQRRWHIEQAQLRAVPAGG